MFDDFLLILFRKYADLLKKRFSDDFREVCFLTNRFGFSILNPVKIVSTDDYMPMPIQTIEEFDKVLNVSWYSPDKPREEQVYVPTINLRHLNQSLLTIAQVSLCLTIFPNVSLMLHRHPQLSEPVLLFCQ